MEAPYSALLGAMCSLLMKFDKLHRTEDRAVHHLIEELEKDSPTVNFGSMSTKLESLSKVENSSLTVNYWMKDARELSYDIEDFVDQFVQLSGADAEMGCVDEQISGFKGRIGELIERYDRYKLEDFLGHTRNTRLPLVYGREPEPGELVGMDGLDNEILQWLMPEGEGDKEMKVVSILGHEGIGKSTLARELWRKLEGDRFECRAFVQTAKKPDMRMILISILSQIQPKQWPKAFQVPNLIADIKKHLQDKRYLIIIDDLCAVSVWDVVSRAFPEHNCCGRIITTTTIEDVSLACCSYDPKYIFKMKPLSEDQSKKLLVNVVFGPGKGFPLQFNDIISYVVTRKCGGLPLAIICIGTLIANLRLTLQQEPERLRKFLYDNFKTNSSSVDILNQVLELCCSTLSHRLKSCLLYLSVYPENYSILKEDLVKQWIAEDFICTPEGKDIVDAASSYFDELLNFGFIQRMNVISSNNKKRSLSYTVHPVVFDYITCKSMEYNFVTIIDYSQSRVVLTEKIRRLSLHFGSATNAMMPASMGLRQVRTLAFMGLLGCMPSLVEFKLVRVLILHLQGDDEHTRFSLKEILELGLLRYLQVRSNVTIELPEQLGCLRHMETLEVNAEVAGVPSDILHHPRLLHVCLGTEKRHKQQALGPVTSSQAIFMDILSSSPSAAVQVLELLPVPPICTFSRLPGWIKQLHGLRVLKVVVRELWAHDVDHLAELPLLTTLFLYVRKHTHKRVVTFRRGAFPALEYFKLVSGMLLLSFREEAVPNLRILEICFNVHSGDQYKYMLGGIQHLLKLKEVVASIGVATGAEETDFIAAESALQDTIGKHPSEPKFVKGKRLVDPVDEE